MGYYTSYNLQVEPADTIEFIRAAMKQDAYSDLDGLASCQYRQSFGCYEAKWYNWEEDMKKLSALFPDVTFTLTGDGEEAEDSWKTVFKGGEVLSSDHTVSVWSSQLEEDKKLQKEARRVLLECEALIQADPVILQEVRRILKETEDWK